MDDYTVGVQIQGMPEKLPKEFNYIVAVSAAGYLYFYSGHYCYDSAKSIANEVDGAVMTIKRRV